MIVVELAQRLGAGDGVVAGAAVDEVVAEAAVDDVVAAGERVGRHGVARRLRHLEELAGM